MRPEKNPASTLASRNLRTVALTVALGAAGISTAAGAQTVAASASYGPPAAAAVHVAHSHEQHELSPRHALHGAAFTRLPRPHGGGCTSTPAGGIDPMCWQPAQ